MLTEREIISLLNSIDVSGFPFECRFEADARSGMIRCKFSMKVINRDNPSEMTWIRSAQSAIQYQFADRDGSLRIARGMIREMLLHELDECGTGTAPGPP